VSDVSPATFDLTGAMTVNAEFTSKNAVLQISSSHTGNFSQGQNGAQYTLAVSNAGNAGPTSGPLTVTENLPAGMTPVSMSGYNWTCSGATCTYKGVVATGQGLSEITTIVNVAANAPPQLTNQVTVSGGGSATFSASDPTSIGILQTIAFAPLSELTFGAAPFTVSATSSSGLPVVFSAPANVACTVSGATVTIVSGGVCTLTAMQTGNGTYGAASVSQSFAVAPTNEVVNFGPLPNVLYHAGLTLTTPMSASGGGNVPLTVSTSTSSVCNPGYGIIYVFNPGLCTVTVKAAGNLSYFSASTTQSFYIATSVQTITFGGLPNVALNATPFTVHATASSGYAVSFASNTPVVCTVSGTTVTIVAGGGCSVTASQAGDTTYAPAQPVTQKFTVFFGDVASDDFDYAAINAMAQYGITNGCGANDFCPNLNVTRDEMAIFVVRAVFGNDNFTYNPTPYFTDVSPSTFGFKWIQKLKDLGITSGCTATTYCPGEVVTRDQAAVFIERARLGIGIAGPDPTFTYPGTPYFTDATAANEFAFPWIQRMKMDGITNGCTTTTYCPTDAVTRGEMAIFIMRGAFNQFLPAGTPVISSISPSTLAVGGSGTFTITGVNTNFVQGTTVLSPIPGVTIGTITVNSATSLTVQLSAAANAVAQPYSVLAITGSEQAVLPNGLVVQ